MRQRLRKNYIFKMNQAHGDTSLEERHCQAEEVGHLRVVVSIDRLGERLEHQGVGHQDADALRTLDDIVGQGHIVEGLHHYLHLGREVGRDSALLPGIFSGLVFPFVDTFGPGHDFVIVDARIKQLGYIDRFVIAQVFFPVPGPIFEWVGEEEKFPARRSRHGFQTTIFQERRFKDTLARDTVEIVGKACRPGPYLCYITIHAREGSQARFRTDDRPLGIVDKRMQGDVTTDIPVVMFPVLLGKGEAIVESTVEKMVFQFVGKERILRRRMLGSPRKAIIVLPFPTESGAIAGCVQEFRLRKVEGINARVDNSTNLLLLQVSGKGSGRDKVGDRIVVPADRTVAGLLAFVLVNLPIPVPGKILFVFAP